MGAKHKYRWRRVSASPATDTNLSHGSGTGADQQFGTRERKWTSAETYSATKLVVCGVDRSGDGAGSCVMEGDRQNIENRLSTVVPRIRRPLLAAASAEIFVGRCGANRLSLAEMYCDIFARRDEVDDQQRMIQKSRMPSIRTIIRITVVAASIIILILTILIRIQDQSPFAAVIAGCLLIATY